MREKQIEGIETVGDLFSALADCPKDMAIGDVFGDPLCLTLNESEDEPYIEVN